jgi:hypothetical protein
MPQVSGLGVSAYDNERAFVTHAGEFSSRLPGNATQDSPELCFAAINEQLSEQHSSVLCSLYYSTQPGPNHLRILGGKREYIFGCGVYCTCLFKAGQRERKSGGQFRNTDLSGILKHFVYFGCYRVQVISGRTLYYDTAWGAGEIKYIVVYLAIISPFNSCSFLSL